MIPVQALAPIARPMLLSIGRAAASGVVLGGCIAGFIGGMVVSYKAGLLIADTAIALTDLARRKLHLTA